MLTRIMFLDCYLMKAHFEIDKIVLITESGIVNVVGCRKKYLKYKVLNLPWGFGHKLKCVPCS